MTRGHMTHALLLLLLWISAFQLIDAAITASINPTSLVAGVTGTVNVALTTSVDIPVGGSIVITFPSTFYVDSTTLTNPVGIHSTSTVAAVPAGFQAIVTIATTTATAGSISFTIDGISNPGTGVPSDYIISTKSSGGTTLETATAPKSTFTPGTNTDAVMTTTPSSPVAGATTAYTITFTTGVTLRIGSTIVLQFPILANSKIIFIGATLSNLVNINAASTTVQIASPYIRLTVAGQDIPAATSVAITYSNIINPAAQTTGFFGVHTRHPTGAIFEENQVVPPLTYSSTTLPSATVTPTSYFAGIPTTYTVKFANSAYLPTGSRVELVFPSRFDISGATLIQTVNLPSVNTVLSLPGANTVRLTLGNVDVRAGTGRVFGVKGIVNPGTSCDQYIVEYCTATWETYTLKIYDSGGINLFEQLVTVTGTPIVKKPLTFGRVRPLLKTPLTLTVATVALNTEAAIPLGGSIGVVFPAGYSVGTAPITASEWIGISTSSTTVAVSGNTVALTIAGAKISPTGNLSTLSFTIDKITTPSNSAVGTFIVRTLDAGGNTIEENENIGGEGCTYTNDCSGHGVCTLLSKSCICNSGWGAPTDIADYKSPDCSTRVCPSDYSWNPIPTDSITSHTQLEECSGMGICDRQNATCSCFPGFEGAACQRMGCPNDCSGLGACMSMAEMAIANNAQPVSGPTTYGGTATQFTTTWDASRIFGCVCDSGWAVGLGSGELQATEFFGADCSKRHCPIGNDPETTADETNCAGKTVPGGTAVGGSGNLCLVECSNRGVCDYRSGTCTCFTGYTGYACQTKDNLAK